MEWNIPGTVINCPTEEVARIEDRFNAMFMGGDIVLSQVVGITGLESHAVQNWVKRGFLTPPRQKRYSMQQLCRIITINMLKSALPMDQICKLLYYVNGKLDDAGDDIIDDSRLYFMFVRLAVHIGEMDDPDQWNACIAREMEVYKAPCADAARKVEGVLQVMLTAWAAVQLQKKAEQMLLKLRLPDLY